MTDRAALRELCANATPGPWEIYADDDDVIGQVVCQMWPKQWKIMRSNAIKPFADTPDPYDNAAFIAAARNALPAVLDALEAAEAEVARLTAALLQIVSRHPGAPHGEHPAVDIARAALADTTEPLGER